jgi:hypothetical protein
MSYYVLWEDGSWRIEKQVPPDWMGYSFRLVRKQDDLARHTYYCELSKSVGTGRFYNRTTFQIPSDYPVVPNYIKKKLKHYIKIRKLLP